MIELSGVSFRYGGTDHGVEAIDLDIEKGACVVLTGRSGCGKTTLTRLINGLAPSYYAGTLTGRIRIDGRDITDMPAWAVGRLVGSVFQDPKSQFFSNELTGEVAFACENYGYAQADIRRRTADAIAAMRLSAVRNRPLHVLSSGEKQRTAIASVYALRPEVLVCDEPTANLDADGISELRAVLAELKAAGYTLVIAEHRLAWLVGLADRFVYMENGRIAAIYEPGAFRDMPAPERQAKGLRNPNPMPLPDMPAPPEGGCAAALGMAALSGRIGGVPVFENLTGVFPVGKITAVTGRNGAGKTTVARVLSGLARQSGGAVLLSGQKARPAVRRQAVYYCGNDTGVQFFTPGVSEELLLKSAHTPERLDSARRLLIRMGLYADRDAHPSALSGGQKQRLAIACALFSERPILIFDEPTSGLDGGHMALIAEELRAAADRGRTVIVLTHDAELMAACCDYRFRL